MPRAAVISISHGGGPMPVLGDPGHANLVRSLREKVPALLRLGTPSAPRAIVVVTAHWSTGPPGPRVSSGARHELLYDYGGFPREAYALKYEAPGAPGVAREVKRVLDGVGFATVLDEERGWDHGVFIPFLLINPAADIPIVQLSVLQSEDPAAHLRMGRALGQLRDSNVAIVGSGFASFHNLRLMFSMMSAGGGGGGKDVVVQASKAFNAAVTEAVTGGGGKGEEKEEEEEEEEEEERRFKMLEGWRGFPEAYTMHPRGGAEHFLPLLVCCGAGGGRRGKGYVDEFHGVEIWSYYWE